MARPLAPLAPRERFFDQPFIPGREGELADGVREWLGSAELAWLRAGVPASLWTAREGGERLDGNSAPVAAGVRPVAVAARAAALGLRSQGEPRLAPEVLVVLGGRRLAPLNRAAAAGQAVRRGCLRPAAVVLLCAERELDREERESREVRSYAEGARTEADLMRAAARRVFGARPGESARHGCAGAEVRLIEVSGPGGARASTHETLRAFAAETPTVGAVALFSSPTCRPYQHLEAARALGLRAGIRFQTIAHPPSWAAPPGRPVAPPHVYLGELEGACRAAARLFAELGGSAPLSDAVPVS